MAKKKSVIRAGGVYGRASIYSKRHLPPLGSVDKAVAVPMREAASS